MPTPKALRAPPPRIFENYVLTRVIGPGTGLVELRDSQMQPVPGGGTLSPGLGGTDDGRSDLIPIGFDFVFDQKTYSRMVVNTNGWLALCESTATDPDVVTGQLLLSQSYQNEGINLSNSSNNVLVCPWFDDLRNVFSSTGGTGLSTNTITRMTFGYEPPSIKVNAVEFGVKIYYDPRSSEGRRTVVRWNSLSDYTNASTIIKFECVIYENGVIEFRYVPRQNLTLQETVNVNGFFIEDATIGIFAPGTNRFRDFSEGLGYLDGSRQQYIYGGNTYDSSFSDSGIETFPSENFVSRPYVWRLRPASHWPGLRNFGTILRFAPPMNRRKVLPRRELQIGDSQPRLPTIARTGDSRTGNSNVFFDDRRSAPFISGTIVNFPTTLVRFLGDSEQGVTQRQDLFNGSGLDFLVTSSINKPAIDPFLSVLDKSTIRPWGENKDQVVRSDVFFISGSGLDTGVRLDTPLWSKTQIKVSFPVNYTTALFGTTASMYYYNQRYHAWLLPDNTTGTSRGSDIALPSAFASSQEVLEDHRGFGPVGNLQASGSNDPVSPLGTNPAINSPFDNSSTGDILSRNYSHTVTINPIYEATTDETFVVPIQQPFLLEKAVFEIPMTMGMGWFQDQTTSFLPIAATTGSFDFAGPGITVALFNQLKVNNSTRRDLVMTGTITHVYDNIAALSMSNFPSLTTDFQVRPVGFLSYASRPGSVVSPNRSDTSFTGSVRVQAEATITNGMILRFSKDMVAEPSSEYPTNRAQVLNLLDQPELTLLSGSGLYSIGYNVAYIDPFGRASTGFEPSGRSILGKEYSTSQETVLKGKVANPFYTTGSARAAISSSLALGSRFRAVAAIPLEAHFRSPYLLLPGDRLVLALAKSRPFYYNATGGAEFSGSIAHDVGLQTGSINVTLFGSLLQAGAEFHDTQNQQLASDAIHEVIDNSAVLDQFAVAYRDEFVGSIVDDYITGSLITATIANNKSIMLITGSRGRVFSKFNARSQAVPDLSDYETSVNPSKNFRLQPWYERVGTPRVVRHVDNTERFWDSMLPSISECFRVDGASIWLTTGSALLGDSRKVVSESIGRMLLNSELNLTDFNLLRTMTDNDWTKAFPYEPKYSQIPRQKDNSKSFIATSIYDVANVTLNAISPRQLTGFYFGTESVEPNDIVPVLAIMWRFLADANLTSTNSSGFYPTSSAGLDDTIRVLYGFGDHNNIFSDVGTNHFAEFKNHEDYNNGFFITRYDFGPIIRGWKYGLYSGLTANSQAVFRRDRFGQFRDMLEQRPFTKYFISPADTSRYRSDVIGPSPIQVKFVDALGNITSPANTQSQNLSFEATSSMPYFDGETRDRTDINVNTTNAAVIALKSDQFNNVVL